MFSSRGGRKQFHAFSLGTTDKQNTKVTLCCTVFLWTIYKTTQVSNLYIHIKSCVVGEKIDEENGIISYAITQWKCTIKIRFFKRLFMEQTVSVEDAST